jgi:hypothetical protein
MKKGLIDLARYYSTGIGLIYLIYVILGKGKPNALAPYHYAIIIMYFISVIWLTVTINSFLIKRKRTSYLKTVIAINAAIIVGFTLWMYLLISN